MKYCKETSQKYMAMRVHGGDVMGRADLGCDYMREEGSGWKRGYRDATTF